LKRITPSKGVVEVGQADLVKLYWRGAARPGSYIVPIDIVTLKELPKYVARKKQEITILFRRIEAKLREISECFRTRSLKPLTIEDAARGYLGVPQLLRELRELEASDPDAGRKVELR
jgi:hypothetical protein